MSLNTIARLTPIAAVLTLAACGTSTTSISTKTVTVTGTSTSSTQPTSSTPPATASSSSAAPTTSTAPAPTTSESSTIATHHPPSATGSPVTPMPVVLKPLITTYSASQTKIACSAGGPGVPAKLNWDITLTWATKHATAVYLGADTTDAVHNSYSGAMAPSGSMTVNYGCYDSHTYTLAAVGSNGKVVQQTITVKNVGDPGA